MSGRESMSRDYQHGYREGYRAAAERCQRETAMLRAQLEKLCLAHAVIQPPPTIVLSGAAAQRVRTMLSRVPAIADRAQKTSPAAAGDFSNPEQTMTVRAKFKVTSTTQREHWDKQKGHIHEIELQPVIGGSPENESFYAATPGGMVKLQTVSHEAGQRFDLGAEYYIDFTPADGGKRED